MARHRPAVLCVANFPANTGFAWSFIERVYADVADRLAREGIETWVAFPEITGKVRSLGGSAAQPLEMPVRLDDPGSVAALVRTIRTHRIRTVYLADRPVWHPVYALLRVVGVKRIVVHDHTSGERTVPTGLKRFLKRASRALPGMLADRVVAVSDYVARRKVEVDLVPPGKVVRVWNAIPEHAIPGRRNGRMRAALGLPEGRPVIACACRATPEKGVETLLSAFEIAAERLGGAIRPLLVYMGDGPAFDRLDGIRRDLRHAEDVLFTGYRDDASRLVGDADVAVVPSVWEEAFGLAALEPMAAGVPVIASNVGGIPEVIVHGETGLLVPPADPGALADGLVRLLSDEELRTRMGRTGRRRAREHFGWDRMLDRMVPLLLEDAA